ncbi:MAG TPA: hypothetical protein ENJ53_07405 [Phaeodactylibacter sp.]|nr:hypothetical protein [Phaeodactylibacter sp.]
MKNSRRKFIKKTSQIALVTGFSAWWMTCDSSTKPNEISPKNTFLEVAKIFSDNMILQRDEPILIWGWSNPNATVIVFFDKKKYETVVHKEDGFWKIKIPAQPVGTPHVIKIKQGIHEIEIKNILMGDVYLCSGQSNMEWPMDRVDGGKKIIANANDLKIRHFKIPVTFSIEAQKNVDGQWAMGTPEEVAHFSAAAYFFAKNIRQKYDVPIGLVNATMGGSILKMWMSATDLGVKNIHLLVQKEEEKQVHILEKKYGDFPTQKIEIPQTEFSGTNVNDDNWTTVLLPLQWGESDFRAFLGKMWFRKTFFLKKQPPKNASIKISLAQIDDADISFLNGKKIGAQRGIYDKVRQYEVEASFLKKGKNVLAIQVENTADFGGIFGKSEDLFLEINHSKIPLAGDWKIKLEAVRYNRPQLFASRAIPSVLFNTMIAPLRNFRFRGILWYQGESDVVEDRQEIFAYRFLFQKQIESWRTLFSKPELPFIFAQISNANSPCQTPNDSLWAWLRESQTAALQLPNTAQVINIDSGKHANSMHPQNKPELGRRLALAVRKLVYGETIVASGPMYERMERHGKFIHIYFSNIANGLVLKKGNEVKELIIKGENGKFLWAKSRLEHNHIVVWHSQINEPVAVRYAWCDNPLEVNLYNSEGLPAAPFRTDVHDNALSPDF